METLEAAPGLELEDHESPHPRESYLQSLLPPELILLILRLLPSRDKLNVRATCRRLHTACGAAAAWPWVCLDYCSTFDKKALTTSLRLSATGVRTLSVNAHGKRFPYVLFSRLVSLCGQLRRLSVLGFFLNSEQMTTLVASLPQLTHLVADVRFDTEYCHFCFPKPRLKEVSALQSFEARVSRPHHQSSAVLNALRDWQKNKFFPSEFRLSNRYDFFTARISGIETFVNYYFVPQAYDRDGDVCFQLMQRELPLSLGPARPLLELRISSSPAATLSVTGGEGVPSNSSLYLVTSPPLSALYCQADTCPHVCSQVPFLSVSRSLAHLNLCGCTDLGSADLEEVATYCPQLKSLNLGLCRNALVSLSGLRHIATECVWLERLSLAQVHEVEYPAQLWEVLAGIGRLTCLVMTSCMLGAVREAEQGCEGGGVHVASLMALEVGHSHHCSKCQIAAITLWKALAHLKCCRLRYLKICPVFASDSLTTALSHHPHLEFLYLHHNTCAPLMPQDRYCYQNITKCYILSWGLRVSDALIEALVHSGTLTHLLLQVSYISDTAMCKLICQRQLVSCHVRVLGDPRTIFRNPKVIRSAAKAKNIPDFSYSVISKRIDLATELGSVQSLFYL